MQSRNQLESKNNSASTSLSRVVPHGHEAVVKCRNAGRRSTDSDAALPENIPYLS